jgi:hypothetical protein
MANLTLEEARAARDNISRQDALNAEMLRIESQTLAWIGSATTLYNDVVEADKANVLVMRQLLIDKLTAAVAI